MSAASMLDAALDDPSAVARAGYRLAAAEVELQAANEAFAALASEDLTTSTATLGHSPVGMRVAAARKASEAAMVDLLDACGMTDAMEER